MLQNPVGGRNAAESKLKEYKQIISRPLDQWQKKLRIIHSGTSLEIIFTSLHPKKGSIFDDKKKIVLEMC